MLVADSAVVHDAATGVVRRRELVDDAEGGQSEKRMRTSGASSAASSPAAASQTSGAGTASQTSDEIVDKTGPFIIRTDARADPMVVELDFDATSGSTVAVKAVYNACLQVKRRLAYLFNGDPPYTFSGWKCAT